MALRNERRFASPKRKRRIYSKPSLALQACKDVKYRRREKRLPTPIQLILKPRQPARQETNLQLQRQAELFLLGQSGLVLGQPRSGAIQSQRVAPGRIAGAARQ